MVEAIILVRSMWSMRKSEIAEKAQDKYKSFIRGIPLSRFADASVKADMTERYFRSKSNSPEGFLTKANDVLKNMRAVAAGIRGIGTPLHQIPSGKSQTDMKNEFILKLRVWNMSLQIMMKNSCKIYPLTGGCNILQQICYLLFLFTGATQTSLLIPQQ